MEQLGDQEDEPVGVSMYMFDDEIDLLFAFWSCDPFMLFGRPSWDRKTN